MTDVKRERRRKISRQPVKEYLKERLKDVKLTVFMGLFVCWCLFAVVYVGVIGHARDIPITLLYLAVVPVFYFAEWSLNMRVPFAYTVFLMLFVLFCHLGACFNFYYIIPHLDDILHGAWGLVFSTIGIILIKAMIGPPKNAKGVIVYVLFGLGFAMLMSVLWEIFEFCGDSLIPDLDMQQDTVVNQIESFMMYPTPQNPSPDNQHTWKVYGIASTVLYDAEGNVIGTIDGGYLDLGLLDTMADLLFCTGFVLLFSAALIIDWFTCKFIYRHFIPSLVGEFDSAQAEDKMPAEGDKEAEEDGQSSEADEETADGEAENEEAAVPEMSD